VDGDEVMQAVGCATRATPSTPRSGSCDVADLPQMRKLRIYARQQ